jgi:predicted DNA-binding helix-hairpin-helix protein
MFVQSVPDTLTKLAQLGNTTLYEPSGDQPQAEQKRVPYQSRSLDECITNVVTPKGKKPILKTMMTSACERNCYYCPFRAGRSQMKRITFSPDELARGFDTLQRAHRVEGIFLSSGIIKGSVTTQDKIIDTIEIIRNRYEYGGYVHLRMFPKLP